MNRLWNATSSRGRGPLRVLVVCDWFLRYVTPYVLALRSDGVEAAVLCRDHALEFDGRREERAELLARLRGAGVPIFVMPGRVSSPRAVTGAFRAALATRRWAPNVVHAQSEVHDPRMLAAIAGYPTALTVHDPELHWGSGRRPLRLRLLQSAWRRRAQLLVTHGDALAAALGARDGEVAVIPHGTMVAAEPMPLPEPPGVLLFGRLERYKGLGVLLEAMEEVWARRPETRLIVAGKGLEANGVPTDPRIDARLGYVPESQVDELFRQASLAVLPYVDGSQSGVGLRALGLGVPAIVTRVGALPELALDDSYVVPPRDPRALAAAIHAHLDDGLAVRSAVLERTRRLFGWEAVAARATPVLAEVAARGRAGVAPPASGPEAGR